MVVGEGLPRFGNDVHVFGGWWWQVCVCVHVPGNASYVFGTNPLLVQLTAH